MPTARADRCSGCSSHWSLPLPRRRHRHSGPGHPGPSGRRIHRDPESLARSENFEAEGGQTGISYTGHISRVNHSAPQFEKFFTKSPSSSKWEGRLTIEAVKPGPLRW